MTNFERYRNEIIKSARDSENDCSDFVIPNVLKPLNFDCNDLSCETCHRLFSAWLLDEYKEPEIDWSKVPVDTKVYVKDEGGKEWFKRYFAKYENGKIYAWDSGYASWTASGVTSWEYAKLAEEENL